MSMRYTPINMNISLETKEISLINESVPCYIFDELNSTFDAAYELLEKNEFNTWSSVLAYSQNKGRGQLRHNWSSPKGNLAGTLRIPKPSFFDCDAIAPIIGGILLNFLKINFDNKRTENSANFQLKWTNDLLINTKNNYFKIGGILVEERKDALFVGIGINVFTKAIFSLDNNNSLPARYLCEFYDMEEDTIFSLWIKLVKYINLCYFTQSSNTVDIALKDTLQAFEIKNNFLLQQDFLRNANNYLAFRDKKVIISNALVSCAFDYANDGSQITEYTGILRDISLDKSSLGGIVIDTQYGRRTFLSGSIRPL